MYCNCTVHPLYSTSVKCGPNTTSAFPQWVPLTNAWGSTGPGLFPPANQQRPSSEDLASLPRTEPVKQVTRRLYATLPIASPAHHQYSAQCVSKGTTKYSRCCSAVMASELELGVTSCYSLAQMKTCRAPLLDVTVHTSTATGEDTSKRESWRYKYAYEYKYMWVYL